MGSPKGFRILEVGAGSESSRWWKSIAEVFRGCVWNECPRNCGDNGSTFFWYIQCWNQHVQVYLEEGNQRAPQQRVLPDHCLDAPLQQANESGRLARGRWARENRNQLQRCPGEDEVARASP